MKSANYFFHTFGWKEVDYSDVHARLVEEATFVPQIVEVTIPKGERYDPNDGGSGRVAVVHKEHCTLKRSGGKNGREVLGSVSCGLFSTPSVEELRGEVHALLAREDVKAVLAPYRKAAEDRAASARERRPSHGPEGEQKKTPRGAKERYLSTSHVVGDSRAMHCDEKYDRALFQAASQFNYLEFPSPGNIPENGITAYVYDRTQGPACAIACGAGTAYRNYLVPLGGTTTPIMDVKKMVARGQVHDRQLNGLAEVEDVLAAGMKKGDQQTKSFFDVKNGYVDSSKPRLEALNQLLATGGMSLVDLCISRLRIAVQQDVEVTDLREKIGGEPNEPRYVTQTYNSALSVGYSRCAIGWSDFATIVLSGTYEATLLAGIINTVNVLLSEKDAKDTPKRPPHPLFPTMRAPPPILLTKVGGGVFGNSSTWIATAMQRSFVLAATYRVPLNVLITHFGSVDSDYSAFAGKSF